MNKEEIENNRIPKEIAKALGIEKEDENSLIAFKQNLYEETALENVRLKKELEQKDTILDKVTEECRKQMTENEETILEIFPQKILNIIEGESNGTRN